MKILLAMDDSACSQVAADAVKEQFLRDHTEVCVFTAVNWEESLPISYGFSEGARYAEDLVEVRKKAVAAAKQMLEQTAKSLEMAGFKSCAVVKTGDPRRAVVGFSAEWKADLIVVGSHGRGGFERLLLGSVAEAVARHAKCSVYIARKDELPADVQSRGHA